MLNQLFRGRRERADLRRVILWMTTRDTGTSSMAMALFLATGECTRDCMAYPHDGGDLGRCIRFLRHMGWERRAPEMTAASPQWAALIAEWPLLVSLYDEAENEEEIYVPVIRSNASAERRAERDAARARRDASASYRLYDEMRRLLDPVEDWREAA